jgi:large subunit ribosomal protein L10
LEEAVARAEKVAEVAGVRDDISSSAATLLTHYRGLTVKELAELRGALRAANAQMRIVKNTLARRAVADAGITGLDEMLTGPTGLVFCQDDPVGPAKALKAFAKNHPALEIRGGYLDGAVLNEAEARALAELQSREELLAQFVGLMYGALANTARLLQASTQKQAQLLAALAADGGPEAKGFGLPVAQAAPSAADAPEASEAVETVEADDAPAEAQDAEAPAAEDAAEAPSADAADDAAGEDAEETKAAAPDDDTATPEETSAE